MAPARRRAGAEQWIKSPEQLFINHAYDSSKRRLAGACSDLDILVNNAGAIPGGTIEEVDDEPAAKRPKTFDA